MGSRRMIVFLGAPTAKDIINTWTSSGLPRDDDASNLPLFKVDPQHNTTGVAWRRLPDPVESLSQELAETSMESHLVENPLLERSLRIYTNDINNDDDMDVEAADNSELSISSLYSPFLTGYDFDVNEITELEDLPSANIVAHSLHRNYSLIVAITEISPCQHVITKFGKSIPLVKLIVADQTRTNFEVACWDAMANLTQSIRKDDIIFFRGVFPENRITNVDLGLTEFRGVVSAGTRRRSRTTVLYRCRRLGREDDVLRPRLDLEDQQTRMVRKLRDWVMRRSWVVKDIPPTLETQESG
jgi:hypothetical protein